MLALIERAAPLFAQKQVEVNPGQLYQSLATLLGGFAQPIPRPQRYENFAKAYGNVVWVYAAVARKAKDIATVPLQVFRRTGEDLALVQRDHPLRRLLQLVNPFLTLPDLLEATSANLDLVGNAYWLLFRSRRGAPTEIWPLRPDRVTILPDPAIYIAGYRYQIGNDVYDFLPDQVIHFKEFNPWNDYYGQGALTPAWDSAVITSEAHKWNRSLLMNSGRLDGLLISDQYLTPTQAQENAERFRQLFTGAPNAGRTLVLGKGLKYETIATTPREVDFVNSLKMTREEILAAIRVPPVILFLESGDIGRRVEQIRDYFHSTIRSVTNKIAGTIQEFLVPQFREDGLEVSFDLDSATAQFEDRLVLAQIDEIMIRNRQRTPNELRKRDGLQPLEGGDTVLVPISMVPIEQAGQGFGSPIGLSWPKNVLPFRPRKALEDSRETLWQEFVGKASRLEASFEGGIRQSFGVAREEIASTLAEGQQSDSAVMTGMITLRTLLVKLGQDQFPSILESGWRRAERLINRLLENSHSPRSIKLIKQTVGLDFDLAIPGLAEYLAGRPVRYADLITASLSTDFRTLLAEIANAGGSVDQMIQAVREQFDVITEARAQLIARTEVIAASNLASLTAYQESGIVEGQEWLSARDANVRESHVEADRKYQQGGNPGPIPLGQPFAVGAGLLMFPGDPDGPIEEIAQCRCTTLPALSEA